MDDPRRTTIVDSDGYDRDELLPKSSKNYRILFDKSTLIHPNEEKIITIEISAESVNKITVSHDISHNVALRRGEKINFTATLRSTVQIPNLDVKIYANHDSMI
ncbi:hypothetical protein TVAG_056270 [Trichomonas vaginalis G3]|uniref:Uncharacterized protein n=1 Tax=Trichomonas vaginalis (strain ATCC PRA-98 / G3) TaxID=412133 RepID=A2ECI6_TRIV3|nr:hypothetical protein TVAGG3_0881630 [Trichomonas vaginalis G3]EAY09583.1 hypothetical protein TVAG_056270 [Trichomonas vaginalis G3]KAI5502094.1 hypothetical protein TVAGG3_0881630 [Trichomonas vaginalis G3]|eukprot:XP_001321806.1 hypothetical protein [Trichomonas vaginalis G3]